MKQILERFFLGNKSMETTRNKIKAVCKKAFEECDWMELDYSKFNEDITCFNEAGKKCSVVFDDNARHEGLFIIVCLTITLEKEWKLAMFETRVNYNGIDAMNLANNYLNGNYSIGDELKI